MNTYVIGKKYEGRALEILIEKGFTLCCKNYRGSIGEIDLILKKDNLIIFVEVKYRKNSNFGKAAEAVNIKKGKKIYITALEYLEENRLYDVDYRFDAITFDSTKYNWIKNCLWGDELGF